MGLFSNKGVQNGINTKTLPELTKDLKSINNITTKELFRKKVGCLIYFQIEKEVFFLTRLMSRTKILAEMKSDVKSQRFSLSIEKFYVFFNILMSCLPIFYDLSKRGIINDKKTKKDDDLCCICEENQPNTMLECYVNNYLTKHFFCQGCIETWLFKKQSNCPLCRVEIHFTQQGDDLNLKKQSWSIISEGDVNKKETLDEMNEMFKSAFQNLIND